MGKNRVWFSTNKLIYLRNTICSEFKVKRTGDFGTYLGVLLICGKLQKKYFHYLIERAEKDYRGGRLDSPLKLQEQYF